MIKDGSEKEKRVSGGRRASYRSRGNHPEEETSRSLLCSALDLACRFQSGDRESLFDSPERSRGRLT
jgi:hypothetical protein